MFPSENNVERSADLLEMSHLEACVRAVRFSILFLCRVWSSGPSESLLSYASLIYGIYGLCYRIMT